MMEDSSLDRCVQDLECGKEGQPADSDDCVIPQVIKLIPGRTGYI